MAPNRMGSNKPGIPCTFKIGILSFDDGWSAKLDAKARPPKLQSGMNSRAGRATGARQLDTIHEPHFSGDSHLKSYNGDRHEYVKRPEVQR